MLLGLSNSHPIPDHNVQLRVILLDSNNPYPTSDMLFFGNPVTTVAVSRF